LPDNINRLEDTLSRSEFLEKAPPEVVQKQKRRLAEALSQRTELLNLLRLKKT
jgi:valyl-tRNA synthetase